MEENFFPPAHGSGVSLIDEEIQMHNNNIRRSEAFNRLRIKYMNRRFKKRICVGGITLYMLEKYGRRSRIYRGRCALITNKKMKPNKYGIQNTIQKSKRIKQKSESMELADIFVNIDEQTAKEEEEINRLLAYIEQLEGEQKAYKLEIEKKLNSN